MYGPCIFLWPPLIPSAPQHYAMALTLQEGRLQFGQMKQDAQGCWLAGHETNILTRDIPTQARGYPLWVGVARGTENFISNTSSSLSPKAQQQSSQESEGSLEDRSSYFTQNDRALSLRENLISKQNALVEDTIRPGSCNPISL